MLDAAHKLTRADEYRRVVRRGRRLVGAVTVSHIVMNPNPVHARFGFIAAKSVGGAVVRNRVRRRLKAATHSVLDSVPEGTEIVVRAQPAAAAASYDVLLADVTAAAARARTLASRS
ncbi:ribonuclease P protein component [Mycetocola reblochoni]|uniref:Ribonuclease P protein component n=2 Tax=Mycetocola reblochoni TaxID=331618 RepID=A0A1R4JFC9_9MICO|nr:ribonuclease P protein component [Mycetocola reblochoni]RLP67741.1 ribonuclease P protein component [Mycetocola reblochoni]SJN30712.1 Ribonuclease P protein component [Mycetocola reblochoni REB411]